jgi:putative flavoprotein involved in K+ transport
MTGAGAGRVVIIGAGPAGLAAGVCLARHGVDFTILERGAAPAAALARVDPEMLLLSPTRLSRLPGMESDPGAPGYVSFRTFAEMLERYRRSRDIAVTTNATVVRVSHEAGRFTVHHKAADGSVRTVSGSEVISAAGTITNPTLPETFRAEACSFPWKHSLDIRAHDLARARRLLVVGGRASAAEVLDRWLEVRSPDARAWLSLRSPLRMIVSPLLGVDIHYLAWLPERLPVRLFGWRVGRLGEPMNARHVLPAIRCGLITRVLGVAEYEGESVTLHDGHRLEPDLVVFATGFRYGTGHLGELLDYDPDGRPRTRNCESTRVAGLFLLGLRYGRTFASPYIRGIGRDAAFVARRIARRWRGSGREDR